MTANLSALLTDARNIKGLYPQRAKKIYKKVLNIDPANSTESFGRSNIYLHDSTKGFSHGCVETQTGLFDQLRAYRAAGNKSIDVIVTYPVGGTSTYGGTRQP